MRDIKFRGKSMGGHWVFGLLSKKKIRNSGQVMFSILTGDSQSSNIPVDENSIGQFSGLKDINGTDIFEGDILQSLKDDFTFTVTFDDGCFTVDHNAFLIQILTHKVCKVIGNIFDRGDPLA